MITVIYRSRTALSVLALAVTLGVCLSATTVSAQPAENSVNSAAAQASNQTTSDPQQEARENIQAERTQLQSDLTASTAEKRAQIQERTAQRKASLEARVQERVTNLSANMSNRMESVIDRLQNITNRMESRLTKMQADGINTTDSAAALASAQLSLDAAAAEISDIDVAVYKAVSSQDMHAGWSTLKTKFTTIANFIRTAHSQIRSSISLLKEATLQARAQQSDEVSTQSNN